MRISEAIEQYIAWRHLSCSPKTRTTYAQSLRLFALYVRDKDLCEITEHDALEWLMGMESLGWERNSLIPKASALRGMFGFWRKKGVDCFDPELIPLPRTEYSQPKTASDDDIDVLLRALTNDRDARTVRNRAIILMLRATGVRVGELCAIDTADVRLDDRSVVIRTEKSRGRYPFRRVFWTECEDASIRAWAHRRKAWDASLSGDAFLVSCVGVKSGDRLTIKGVEEMLRRLSARAGIPTVNPHSFRHRFGRVLAESGANNSAISSLLGHSSLASSYQYTRLWDESARRTYDDVFGG